MASMCRNFIKVRQKMSDLKIGMQWTYQVMVETLKRLDSKQLQELFHDIDDVDCVAFIAEEADCFVFDQQCKAEEGVVSDEQDAIDVDDARRAREL